MWAAVGELLHALGSKVDSISSSTVTKVAHELSIFLLLVCGIFILLIFTGVAHSFRCDE